MARPIGSRRPRQPWQVPMNSPQVAVTPYTHWRPSRGLNLNPALNQVPKEFARDLVNMYVRYGKMTSRWGTAQVGEAADDPIIGFVCFTSPNGKAHLLRFTTVGLERYSPVSGWEPVSGVTLHGDEDDLLSYTGWGEYLLFTNGVDKMYAYSPIRGTVEQVDEAPAAKHLTTFGGRVIASSCLDGSQLGYRVRWSAKLDYTDWTGIGSGFEDLFAAPGGVVDEVMGCYPVSDEIALMIRGNSIWQMSQTGDPDAPFRFSTLFTQLGCPARNSIALVPGGVVFLGYDNIYAVSTSGPVPIGQAIIDRLIPNLGDFESVHGFYDTRRQEYRLAVKDGTPDRPNVTWRYSFVDKAWSRDDYPFQLKCFGGRVEYSKLAVKIDELTGTIDALEGTIDELSIAGSESANYFVPDTPDIVVREDPLLTTDVDFEGSTVESMILAKTGDIVVDSFLNKTEIIEVQLEYEADEAQDLVFEYSTDGGNSWTTYSTATVDVTTRPTLLSVRKTAVAQSMQIQMRSDSLGKLTIHSLTAFVIEEARHHP